MSEAMCQHHPLNLMTYKKHILLRETQFRVLIIGIPVLKKCIVDTHTGDSYVIKIKDNNVQLENLYLQNKKIFG